MIRVKIYLHRIDICQIIIIFDVLTFIVPPFVVYPSGLLSAGIPSPKEWRSDK